MRVRLNCVDAVRSSPRLNFLLALCVNYHRLSALKEAALVKLRSGKRGKIIAVYGRYNSWNKTTAGNGKENVTKQKVQLYNDRSRKRTPFLIIGAAPMMWDKFSIFRTNCAMACGTRAYMLRRFLRDVAWGKWCPKFPKSFMLLVYNSTCFFFWNSA